jgi:2-oxoglutarate ferredoxin oxidoreductase subunit gamma
MAMQNRREIRLSGSGGQGILLAGIILAEAALLEGKNAVQSQSYGPEARGGASKSEVIISEESIDYPKVTRPEILMALTEEAYHKYTQGLTAGSILVIDDSIQLTEQAPGGASVVRAPIIQTATETMKRPIVANIVALRRESLEQAVLNRVPRGTEDLNRQALSLGFQLAAAAADGNR